MKKIILFSAFLVMQSLLAQQDIDFTITYSNDNSRYEVYAKSNFTENGFTWGPSQISVAVPASFPDQALLITSHSGGSWGDNSIVYAPGASSSYDFHGISSGGQLTNLVANQEKLIFSFVSPSGSCIEGLRLFVNGVDPDSSQAGMAGGDFSNTIDNGNNTDVYNANYNNTGTVCSTLSNETVVLTTIDINVYPNPVATELTISGLTTKSNNIEIFAYNGQWIKSFDTVNDLIKLDFSSYADGVYFVKIQNSENNYVIKKIIKKP